MVVETVITRVIFISFVITLLVCSGLFIILLLSKDMSGEGGQRGGWGRLPVGGS